MALTPAQRKANDKYIKANYTQVKLSMPNREAQILDKYCLDKGLTKAGFIRQAIKEKMSLLLYQGHISRLVGMIGFEPMVFCSQSRRDNQASLHPEAQLFSS